MTRADLPIVGQGALDDVVALCRRVRVDAIGIDSLTATPLHEADVVIQVEAMRHTVEKSRYQGAGDRGDVLAHP